MQTILEGIFAEVQSQLKALPVNPETRLRIIVSNVETETPLTEPFRPTEFRNGVPLLPRRELSEPITLELVKRLSEEDDEEIRRVYHTVGR